MMPTSAPVVDAAQIHGRGAWRTFQLHLSAIQALFEDLLREHTHLVTAVGAASSEVDLDSIAIVCPSFSRKDEKGKVMISAFVDEAPIDVDDAAGSDSKEFEHIVSSTPRNQPSNACFSSASSQMRKALDFEMGCHSASSQSRGFDDFRSSDFRTLTSRSDHKKIVSYKTRRSIVEKMNRATVASYVTETSLAEDALPSWYHPKKDQEFAALQSFRAVGETVWAKTSTLTFTDISARWLLSPLGITRTLWDLCACFAFMVDLWVLPLPLLFLTDGSASKQIYTMHLAVTLFFTCDIVLNFFTGIQRGAQLILHPRFIANAYLKSWFWLDVLATFPWDHLLGQEWCLLSLVRAVKIFNIWNGLKTYRMLRIENIFRCWQPLRNAVSPTFGYRFYAYVVKPIEFICLVLIVSHVNACAWTLVQPTWEATGMFDDAMWMYFKGVCWSFMALTSGPKINPEGPTRFAFGILSMVVTLERLCLCSVFIFGIAFLIVRNVQEDAHLGALKESTSIYLRQHKVGAKLQRKILRQISETWQAHKFQQNFKLMVDDLPASLHTRLCEELWAQKLMSLGLIMHVSHWHNDLIPELALASREESYVSRTALFREGDAANAAYYITVGVLAVVQGHNANPINNFTTGMWLGEKALVNPLLRRSATVVTRSFSTLMKVPGDVFHDLLRNMDLLDDFHAFISDHLWRGLCGRCGVLGDHFTHKCPLQGRPSKETSSSMFSCVFNALFRTQDTGKKVVSGGLKRFLEVQHLRWLVRTLEDLGITEIEQLKETNLEDLRRQLGDKDIQLTDEEACALSSDALDRFHDSFRANTAASLWNAFSHEEHLIFLSHFKVEAGTEAALMRRELETLINDDPGSPAHFFKSPIFLDSEDLRNLDQVQTKVQMSHNLVLLLSEHVLLRPWVLIEIVTAFEAGVRILPVILLRGFGEFTFPDESYFETLSSEGILDDNGVDVLSNTGIDVARVISALRDLFKRIAVPYSPHRPEMIRQIEVQSLLNQCHVRRAYMPAVRDASMVMLSECLGSSDNEETEPPGAFT